MTAPLPFDAPDSCIESGHSHGPSPVLDPHWGSPHARSSSVISWPQTSLAGFSRTPRRGSKATRTTSPSRISRSLARLDRVTRSGRVIVCSSSGGDELRTSSSMMMRCGCARQRRAPHPAWWRAARTPPTHRAIGRPPRAPRVQPGARTSRCAADLYRGCAGLRPERSAGTTALRREVRPAAPRLRPSTR